MEIKFSRIIDLSLQIDITMATYPGETVLFRPTEVIPKNKYNVQTMHIFTHTGTHLDAPWHVLEQGKRLNQYPLEQFIAPCVKLDLTKHKKELSRVGAAFYLKVIERRHLQEYENQIKQAQAIVLHTGYGEVMKLGRQFIDMEFPYLTEDAAKYLAQFTNLKLIGIDSLTIDKHEVQDSHKAILGKTNILVLETLTNLEQVPERFMLVCFPLNVKDADGAPCRALALIP